MSFWKSCRVEVNGLLLTFNLAFFDVRLHLCFMFECIPKIFHIDLASAKGSKHSYSEQITDNMSLYKHVLMSAPLSVSFALAIDSTDQVEPKARAFLKDLQEKVDRIVLVNCHHLENAICPVFGTVASSSKKTSKVL